MVSAKILRFFAVKILKKYKPEVKVGTVTTVLQADLEKLADENKGKADFIIVVPEDMTTTH